MSFSRFLLERSPVNLMEEDKVIEFLDNILTKCKPFLKHKQPLYRGANKSSHGYMGSNTIRTDRKPRDTSKGAHMFFNDRLKQLGLPSREEVLFTTPNLDFSYEFGAPYLIFPIGNFKFFWIKNISDLTDSLPMEYELFFDEYMYWKGSPQEYLDHLRKPLNGLDNDIPDYIISKSKHSNIISGIEQMITDMADYNTKTFPNPLYKNEVSIAVKDYYYLNSEEVYDYLLKSTNPLIKYKAKILVKLLNIEK
jgi:hypothetical protein